MGKPCNGGGAKGPAHRGPVRSSNRGRRVLGGASGQSESAGKPFEIPKQRVWEAYRRVTANKGAAGVDGQSIEEFEKDLRNNLYKIWNRMSSGTYFPPPVLAVEIPKPHGGGTRILGVPTVADRVAQTVVALALEPEGRVDLPRLLWVPAGPVGAGCGGRVSAAVLEEGLGDRSGYPEVLRQRAVGTDGQGGAGHTPSSGGCCCMCGGGWPRRCSCPTARW